MKIVRYVNPESIVNTPEKPNRPEIVNRDSIVQLVNHRKIHPHSLVIRDINVPLDLLYNNCVSQGHGLISRNSTNVSSALKDFIATGKMVLSRIITRTHARMVSIVRTERCLVHSTVVLTERTEMAHD